jgi:hypothetical protein
MKLNFQSIQMAKDNIEKKITKKDQKKLESTRLTYKTCD